MQGGGRLGGGAGWRWPSWCTYEPEEMRWLYGVPDAAQSRMVGFFLAALLALAIAATAGYSVGQGDAAGGYYSFAESLAYLALGCLAYRGRRLASLALMALYTVDPTITHLTGHMHGSPYFMDCTGLWPVDALLIWAIWMRVFYVAFRAERQAASASGPDAPAVAGS